MQIILGIALLAVVLLIVRHYSQSSPADVARFVRAAAGVAAIIVALLLTARGAFPLAFPLILVGLGLLNVGRLFGLDMPWDKPKATGQSSSVKTAMLDMTLDHDSQQMDGTVLKGAFEGRKLSELELEALIALLDECAGEDGQSVQILEAYLDIKHPEWRELHGVGNAGGAASETPMDREQALSILGVGEGASRQEIVQAHRKLMKKYHPDHGGSDYLASKINEAKEFLIGS